jgi:hypothetical protein
MTRINGIGTWFLGVTSAASDPQLRHATSWVTFLWLPLFPLARYTIRPLKVRANHMQYQIVTREKIMWSEVLRTYLFGLLLMPLLVLGPAILSIKEIQEAIGVPTAFQMPLMVFSIAWIIVCVWKLKNWEEKRWK